MGKEIEKKFLLSDKSILNSLKGSLYKQGYLNTDVERTVRVRACDGKGYITVKGKNSGAVRLEYEYDIPYKDALEMIDLLCERPIIEKKRYLLDYEGKRFEIDEFYGDNEGLIIAEIELSDENEEFEIPSWIGQEVTGDVRFYNSNLVKEPYRNWK